MRILRTAKAMRAFARGAPRPIALVPTMGALHRGHAELIGRARRQGATVVVSIFVNPTQFGPGEDFQKYPRPFAKDAALCRSLGVDAVFAPEADEMYPPGRASTFVEETRLSLPLCGAARPGHFRGVCTVVAKLFQICDPDAAFFGEKDWQQLAVVRRMVEDLFFRVKIISVPTVREPDGLALSSRNAYLSPAQRQLAPGIYRALARAAEGRSRPEAAARKARAAIEKIPGASVDYVEAVDALSLEPARTRLRPARLLAAVRLGDTRLIDNVPLPALRGKGGK
ncbi:MAG: pantoate--beta-alanine ligase [Terrimicrobiaceae bacterium]|nr:pantoate--beta-alanine ligase [Terrimicrobiaceae bacterium]